MLATRIIPTLLCRGRQLVKGKQFVSWRSVGVAAQAVRIHNARGVDELTLLDISATNSKRGPDLSLIAELSDVCFMPLSVGGGIRTLEQARDIIRAGADKVVIGSGLWFDPYLAVKIKDSFGSQALVGVIDSKDGMVYTNGGMVLQNAKAVNYAQVLQTMGVGEILLTSIEHEGMMDGYDLDLIKEVSEKVDIPVIAHGGCGTYEHMKQAIDAGASAVAAGAMFQFTDNTPRAAAHYLNEQGVEVRI